MFWWDNFDRNIETSSGGGSIHNTPGIVFQEQSSDTLWQNREINIPQSNKRSIQLQEIEPIRVSVNPKTNPGLFIGPMPVQTKLEKHKEVVKLHNLWKVLRLIYSVEQVHPRFAGWLITKFQIPQSFQTVMAYLPPIQRPITEFGTIIEMFVTSREFRIQANMKYTHITLDAGAAMKAFQVV